MAAPVVLAEPSLTSSTGSEAGAGAALPTGFLGMEEAAGSVGQLLPGAGPFLSTLAFSLSAGAGSEDVGRLSGRHRGCGETS